MYFLCYLSINILLIKSSKISVSIFKAFKFENINTSIYTFIYTFTNLKAVKNINIYAVTLQSWQSCKKLQHRHPSL